MSSTLRPISAYFGAYSESTSNRSPLRFAPFCAPMAIRLYAFSLLMPNFCIKADAARLLSEKSIPNVSRSR